MDHGHSRLQVFQRQVELIGIGLLGFASEGCLLERCDQLLKPLDPLILAGDMLVFAGYRDVLDQLMDMKLYWSSEPCATASFEELNDWSQNYILKPFMGIDNSQAFKLFLANRAAMMLEGNWLVDQLRGAKKLEGINILPFPTGTDRLYGFAEYLYVSVKSAHPDDAAKFLD